MSKRRHNKVPRQRGARGRRGWVLIESLVALGMLGLLVAGWCTLTSASAECNARLHLRQQCLAAGQAQLDSFTAAGRPLEPADFQRLWPALRCETAQGPGEGDWAGLRRVTVTVTGQGRGGREIRVSQSRYVAAEEAR